MKVRLSLVLLLFGISSYGQRVINVDNTAERLAYRSVFNGGFPIPNVKYVRLVSGSPFFSDNWMKAEILVNDTTIFTASRLKIDLLEGNLFYLDDKDQEMSASQVFNGIYLSDTTSGNSYLFVHSSYIAGTPEGEMTWYEMITGRKITLFKQYLKRLFETKPFASSVTEQTIETETRYFIASNQTFTRVKSVSDIVKLVSANKKMLTDFIEKNNLKGKSETDFISVVDYYDTLK